jgi:hypothetical protein
VLLAAARRALGPLGDDVAREALEHGALFVDHAVATWESTSGTMRGHRVILELAEDLLARVQGSEPALDALHAAIAAAVAAWGKHDALAELALRPGGRAPAATPYRGAVRDR